MTSAGLALLPHARAVLDALAQAERAAAGQPVRAPLRLGVFPSAGAALVPRTVTALLHPDGRGTELATREGTSPTLARAVESGRLDAAIVVSRPPHRAFTNPTLRLREEEIGTMELQIAAATHHPLATTREVRLANLSEAVWVGPTRSSGDPTLGVWPGLPHRPDIRYRTDDWLAKLRLVADGLAITTVPPIIAGAFDLETRLLRVTEAPLEQRRVTLLTSEKARDREPELPAVLRRVFDELLAAID